jgi:hypothetical protein
MTAYETLWAMERTTQETVADKFRQTDILLSQLLERLKERDIHLNELHHTIKT